MEKTYLNPAVHLIIFAVLAVTAGSLSGCQPHRQFDPDLFAGTNVILVSLDTLRSDRLGCYGWDQPISPFLDHFSRRSFTLSDVVAQYPATVQSHRAIFTSQYYFQQQTAAVNPDMTLAGRFASAGWITAAFVDSGLMNRRFGNHVGFDEYHDRGGHFETILPRAENWLAEQSDHPFLMLLHTYDIHSPYDPPAPYDSLYSDVEYPTNQTVQKRPSGSMSLRDVAGVPAGRIQGNSKTRSEDQDRDPGEIARKYDGSIRYTDRLLENFFYRLEEMGLMDRTVIVVFSDHGESLGEKSFIGHGRLFDNNLRIPMIFHIPGEDSFLIGGSAESIDLMPTLLELFGIEQPETVQGVPFLANMANRSRLPADRMRISEQQPKSVRLDDRWKLILGGNAGSDKLYNVAGNPRETRNVIRTHPRIADDLRNYLVETMDEDLPEIRRKTRIPQTKFKQKAADDAVLMQELKRLGYIQ